MSDVSPGNIPNELKDQPQWICWREEEREGKPTKIPVNPETGGMADATDSDTWTSFDAALAAHESTDFKTDGVGFVFDIDGMYAGVDLDDCVDEDGGMKDWAREIVEKLDSYTEYSPSGTGLHVIVQGIIPPGGNRKGEVEMYDAERFFTFTGDVGMGEPNPVRQRVNELQDVHAEHIKDDEPSSDTPEPEPSEVDLDDDELLEKARNAENGDRFQALWNGRTDDYPSQSEADLALCSHLAFWTGGDRHRIDHLFRQSGLMREKWERDDYRKRTIDKALSGQSDYYDPTKQTAIPNGGEPIPNGGTATASGAPDIDEPTETEGTPAAAIAAWRSEYKDENEKEPTKGEITSEAAHQILKHENVVMVKETEELWRYNQNQGLWTPDAKQMIRTILDLGLKEKFDTNILNETLERIKARSKIERTTLGPPSHHIAVENGLIDLQDGSKRDVEPSDYVDWRMNVEYDPDADCPQFKEFLKQVVDEDDIQKIQEFIGYTLHHWAVPYKKALMLLGPTDAGKSVFLDVVRELYGTDALESVSPQFIANERWGVARLVGTPVNVRHDLDPDLIERLGKIKEVIDGNAMMAEEKNKDPFEVQPKTKHLFAANRSPERESDDKAFWNRWVTIIFPESIPKEEQNENLTHELTQPDELSGVLNWAIEGWQRLQGQSGFTDEPEWYQNKEMWEAYGDSIEQFIDQCIKVTGSSQDFISKSEVHNVYSAFAADLGMEVESQNQLTREMKKKDGISDGKNVIDGSRTRTYRGIEFSDTAEDLFSIEENNSNDVSDDSLDNY